MKSRFIFFVLLFLFISPFQIQAAITELTTPGSQRLLVTDGDSHTTSLTSFLLMSQTSNTGVISALTGGSINARGVTSIITTTMTTSGAHGVYVASGGSITFDTVSISTMGPNSKGILATGTNSSITIDGDLTVSTLGGTGWNDFSSGLEAGDGAEITVSGFTDISAGAGILGGSHIPGIYAHTNAQINLQDVRIRTGRYSNSDGMRTGSGGTINAGLVDILIQPTSTYSYGILAEYGEINIVGGTVSIADAGAAFSTGNASNSALRATGTTGVINVSDTLSITTNGLGSRGAYASDGGTINLHNTTIAIGPSTGNRSYLSPAIQVGKSRAGGAVGSGTVTSTGHLEINQNNSTVMIVMPYRAPAIWIEGVNSSFKADYETSSTNIVTNDRAIVFGGSATASDPDTIATVSLKDATIRTTSTTAHLFEVGGAVTNSSLTLIGGTSTAASNGWLLSMTDRVLTDTNYAGVTLSGSPIPTQTPNRNKESDFLFDVQGTMMIGGITKTGNTTLTVALSDFATWNLQANAAHSTSTMSFLSLDNSSTIIANDRNYTIISPIIQNAGELLLQSDVTAVGKTLSFQGAYTGLGGILKIDTVLGDDASLTDKLNITGDALGTTYLSVRNKDGLGAATVNGILVVGVTGISDTSAFRLTDGNMWLPNGEQGICLGLNVYGLLKGDSSGVGNNWYLRNFLINPAVPLYELYPYILATYNDLGTLQQRVGNRSWAESATKQTIEGSDVGLWIRTNGSTGTYQPKLESNDETYYNLNLWQVELGVEVPLGTFNDGSSLIAGCTAHVGGAYAKVKGYNSLGKIDTTGIGLGATLTWYAQNGFYADAHGKVTWTKGKILSELLFDSEQVSDNKGMAFAMGLEVGKEVVLPSTWTITPQAQLVYSQIKFDEFVDTQNLNVSLEKARSLLGRLGVSINRDFVCKATNGSANSRTHVYAILNLYYEFLNGSKILIDTTQFHAKPNEVWAGVGIGATHNFNNDRVSLYGELGTKAGLSNISHNYGFAGDIGIRFKF